MNTLLFKNKFRGAAIILFLHITIASVFMLQAQNVNPVGAIPGAVDVSHTGAVTYTIPIEVVPGTQGMQPNLSVVYNSFSGMGNLGMKWSLAGLFAITRCGQIPYYDNGSITPIQFNGYDRFALNGERLLNVKGNYGAVGAEYATEIENFTLVVSHGGTTNHPEYFTAYTDDGSVIEYGIGDSKQTVGTGRVLSWFIEKITDVYGNYMTFYYEQKAGEIWITEIEYTGNVHGMKPYAKVKFNYIDLPDAFGKNIYFVGGYGISQTKLLETIIISYNNIDVRKYRFNYNLKESEESTAHLKEILLSEYGENGEEQLKPTIIKWGEQSNKKEEKVLSKVPNGYIITGDFNGDGYMDYVVYGQTETPSAFYQKIWEFYAGSAGGSFTKQESGTHRDIVNEGDCIFYKADLNGDGCDELIIAGRVHSENYEFKILSLKDGETEIDRKVIMNFQQVSFGDFDGDGKTDMLFVKKTNSGSCSFQFYLNSEFKADDDNLHLPLLNNPCKVRVGDFNGDGKTDIELNSDGNHVSVYYYHHAIAAFTWHSSADGFYDYDRYSGDFNGDGITDLLTYEYTQGGGISWKLYFGKGNGKYTQATDITDLAPNCQHQNGQVVPTYKIMIADLDGDGKDDIIQLMPPRDLKILYSKGCAENGKYEWKIRQEAIGAYFSLPKHLNISDFNQDGILDLIVQETRTTKPTVVYLHQDNQYELVKEITDGMNKTIKFDFKLRQLIAWNNNIARRYLFYILDNLQISNGLGGLNSFTYKYDHPVFSGAKRTFLGFQKFITINQQEDKEDLFIFSADNPVGSLMAELQRTFYGNDMASEKLYSVSWVYLPDNRFALYYGGISEYNVLSNASTLTNSILNTQGRLEESRIYNFNLDFTDLLYKETKTYKYNTITLTLDGYQKRTVPIEILTAQQYKNGNTLSPVITDVLTYEYDAEYLVSTREENIHGSITTSYSEFRATGLFKNKTVSTTDCESRTEQYEYDDTDRFVKKITNSLDHEMLFTYDPKTGNKLSEKDQNNLTTTYKYDAFGNPTQINYPDGTQTTISISRYTSSSLPNAYYTTYTTTTGKPALRVYYDILGREVCRNENERYFETRYNAIGQVERTSYPFDALGAQNITWHSYKYDKYGRIKDETAPYTSLTYDYYPSKVTVTDNLRGVSSSKIYDALGRTIAAEDAGGSIKYEYAVMGNGNELRHQTIITTNGATTIILSDLWGNRRSITEPNAGIITSEYNGFNELIEQKDARGNITSYKYDKLGRVTQKGFVDSYGNSQTISYYYDANIPGSRGKVYRIVIDSKNEETFSYNTLGRLTSHTKIIDGEKFTHQYTYTANGQLYTLTYPTGFRVEYSYNTTGRLKQIKRSDDNSLIYNIHTWNIFLAPTRCEYGNGVLTDYEYNPYGLITRIKTGKKTPISIPRDDPTEPTFTVDSTILNYRYAYNNRGLMVSRTERIINRQEKYEYDRLDRLINIASGVIGETGVGKTFTYSPNGNISINSALGIYNYSGNKPHAVIKILPTDGIPTDEYAVTYNFFNQPTEIVENNYRLDLFYGANQQRQKTERYLDYLGNVKESTQYLINKHYEKEQEHKTGITRHYHYIYGDNGVVALYLATTTTDSMYYIHTDHLGSYCAMTNENKKVRQRSFFDPWGNVAQPNPTLNFTLTNRGFTGHEHYPVFKIINMNGRLYDPVIARFFSPDQFVQIPDFTQSYNRYSYCLNNPLHYTDPSGNSAFGLFLNVLFAPARFLTEGFTWVNDKINGDTRYGGYFDPGYIFGQNAPGSLTPYNPVNSVSYGQPGYVPPGVSFNGLNNSGLSYGSGFGLNVDNTTPERFEFEWYWAGGTIGKFKQTKSGNLYGREVPWGQWYTRIVKTEGQEVEWTMVSDREPYSGFWGTLDYILTGGIENGIKYRYDGTVAGYAPIMGNPPIPSFRGGAVFKGGKFVQKMGKAKGNMSGNRAVQQAQFDAVVKELNLTKDQANQLHKAVHNQGYGYHEMLQEAKDLFNKLIIK